MQVCRHKVYHSSENNPCERPSRLFIFFFFNFWNLFRSVTSVMLTSIGVIASSRYLYFWNTSPAVYLRGCFMVWQKDPYTFLCFILTWMTAHDLYFFYDCAVIFLYLNFCINKYFCVF